MVLVRGAGRTEVAAYGMADAEHQLEKEMQSLWPEARVRVDRIARAGGEPRIAEDFALEFRVVAQLEVEARSVADAPREAYRLVRERLRGTRFWKLALEADVRS